MKFPSKGSLVTVEGYGTGIYVGADMSDDSGEPLVESTEKRDEILSERLSTNGAK